MACQDRSLLPEHSLAGALDFVDPYNPRPKWENLKGLFQAIDRGSEPLNIPLYNGGLFAPDPDLDGLSMPDEVVEHLRAFGGYDFRPASDYWAEPQDGGRDDAPAVDVEILGHIFEQSIEDLERLRAELASGRRAARAATRVRQGRGVSRRNREGSFYTPSFATRYMVREALRPVLAERFEAVRFRVLEAARANAEAQAAKGRRRRIDRSFEILGDPQVFDVSALTGVQAAMLVNFWEAWLEELRTVGDELRDAIAADAASLAAMRAERNDRIAGIRAWLRLQHDVADASPVLAPDVLREADVFTRALAAARGRNRPLSAAGVASVLDEHRSFAGRFAEIERETLRLERAVANGVMAAFGLTPEDERELWRTAPPRTPLLEGRNPDVEPVYEGTATTKPRSAPWSARRTRPSPTGPASIRSPPNRKNEGAAPRTRRTGSDQRDVSPPPLASVRHAVLQVRCVSLLLPASGWIGQSRCTVFSC